MRIIKQSSTARVLMFFMASSVDHITGVTGLSPTVTLSKNGAAFGSPSGAVSEVANGWYKVAGNATDSNTLGSLVLHATGTGADPADVEFEVVAFDPQAATNLGLSAIPTAAQGTAGGLPILIDPGSGADLGVNACRFGGSFVNAPAGFSVSVPTNIASTTNITAASGISLAANQHVIVDSGTVNTLTGTVTLADGSLTTAKLGIFALAKGTNITGFNDIAATAIVSSGAITTSAGAVVTVTNLTNAPTVGDFTDTMKTSLNEAEPFVFLQPDQHVIADSVGSPVTLTADYDAAKTAATQASVDALPSASTIATAVSSQVTTDHGSGSYTGGFTFTGARAVTITVNDGSAVIQSAMVRVTQGSSSQLVQTNSSGIASFSLDDGSYTLSITKGGYTYTPVTIAVDATHLAFTKSMAAISIAVPSTGQCVGTLVLLDSLGAPESGVTVYFEAYGTGSADGYGYSGTQSTATTDASGTIARNFPSGSVQYRWRRGTRGDWITFETAAADGATFDIPSGVGSP